MDEYFTYILYSDSDNRYYIGSTQNLELRILRHNDGWSKSTKHGIPWKLVYSESYSSKSEAIKREYEIKQKKNRTYIENLIKKKHCHAGRCPESS